MKRITVSVNLIHYFQDHRQLAKIFVKNDMQTIEDLQNHIIKLFNIDRNFYLMCQNHYLPTEEDIQILNDNDLIFVIPNFNTKEKTTKKKGIVAIETNAENNVEKKSKKKKKQKKIEITENGGKKKNEEYVETNDIEEEKVPKKKKKRQKQIENVDQNHAENELMETSNVKTDVRKKKKRKPNEETPQENTEVNMSIVENIENNCSKNKTCDFPQELIASTFFDETRIEIPPKTKINETIIFRGSNKIDSVFIRENDVSVMDIEANSEYNFVNESRRKRRRCISPNIVLPEQETEENLENNENGRKSIVQTIENLSPNEHSELMENIKYSPRQTYSLADVLHFKNQTSSPATNEINTILEKTSNRPQLRSTRKQLSGVGKVLEFIKTEPTSDDISENNESSYPVPKRKRIRTRKRKQKNVESSADSNEQSDQSVFVPPKTIAAPKFHIKFEDNLDTNANTVKENQNGYFLKPSLGNFESENSFVHSTPLNKTDSFYENRRATINNINPDKLPLMVEIPAVNNIILFKKLKLGSDYNPTVSNYILAEIMEIAKSGDELHLKILEGHEELEDPVGGRFSCNTEDEEQNDYDYDKIQILERSTLINPKVVTNFESQ